MEAIDKRRSIRTYKDKPVEKEKVDKLLHAAMQAPSAVNQQPWEFIIIKDEPNKQTLAQTSPYAHMCENAAVNILMVANTSNLVAPEYWQQDMSAAAENILIEAANLNLGAVWLGVAPMPERMEYISKHYNLPKHMVPFCIIAVGYPDRQTNHFIDRFDSSRIHHESLNQHFDNDIVK